MAVLAHQHETQTQHDFALSIRRDRSATDFMANLHVGDIFHARAQTTASFVCLTLQVTESTIRARRITTQSVHEFDRTTGIEGPEGNPLTIDSVAPLPADIHEIMLGLDRKYAASDARRVVDPDWRLPPEQARLTKEEQRGLVFVGRFYRNHPI